MHLSNAKIFNTHSLEAGVFLLMGGAKTVQDYRSVGEDYKQRILLNDVVVLGASSAAMLGYRALSRNKTIRTKFFQPVVECFHKKFEKFHKSNFSQKHLSGRFDNLYHPLHKSLELSKLIIGTCISNVLMVASGLFGAIAGDYALTKTGLGVHKFKEIMEEEKSLKPKPVKKVESLMKTGVDTVFNKDVRREMQSRVTDLPLFNLMTTSFIGLEGLKITDDEKYSKQVKNASKYLLVNSLVPLFFLSLSSALTKKLKNIYRFPIMFASLVAGTFAVKKGLDNNVKKN